MNKRFEITQYNTKTLLVKDFTLKKRYHNGVNNSEKSQLVKVIISGQAYQMKFVTTLNIYDNMLHFGTDFATSSPTIIHEMEAMRKDQFPCKIRLNDCNNWCGWYTISSLVDVDDAMFDDESNRYLIKFAQVTRLVTETINLDMNKRSCVLDSSSTRNLLDFSIIVNNREIKASKYVLAMKSKVFWSMFQGSNWKDVREGRIEVEDIEYGTMFAFIQLLHGSKWKLQDPVEALKLRVISDKYEVNDLIQLCDNVILDNLNEENAIETLIYANQIGLTYVKNAVIDLLTSSSVKFSTLPNVDNLHFDLCIEIIDAFQSKKQEDVK